MNGKNLSWPSFKSKLINVGVPHYLDNENNEYITIFCNIAQVLVECTILKSSEDYQDYLSSFKSSLDSNGGYDHAGRQIIRTAATFKNWSYLANCFNYTLSSGEISSFDAFDNDLSSEFIVKRYNAQNE